MLPSSLEEVKDPLWTDKGIRLWIKRDDLIHPVVSGNKYRKLRFVLPLLEQKAYRGVLSFGGKHSNHIHALAWLCRAYDIPLTVFIRTHSEKSHSFTLRDVDAWGAEIRYLTPAEYRNKDTNEHRKQLENEFPNYLIIPEGGSHESSLEGIGDMMMEIERELLDPDIFICPVGTGATLAGIIKAKDHQQRAIGVSSLKSSILHLELKEKWDLELFSNWTVADQWHFGGYGRITDHLIKFIDQFECDHGILLDPLYNGKAMYAFYQYVKYGLIPEGSRVVFIHTGGLQGWRGFLNSSKKRQASMQGAHNAWNKAE